MDRPLHDAHALANSLAAKWADKFAKQNIQVYDWDLKDMRNADLAYYMFQALLEMHRSEFSRGWNACLARQERFAKLGCLPRAPQDPMGKVPAHEPQRVLRIKSRIHTGTRYALLFALKGRHCVYCNVPLTLSRSEHHGVTRDHFIPQRFKGSRSVDNIYPCCRRCNSAKADTHPLVLLWAGVLG